MAAGLALIGASATVNGKMGSGKSLFCISLIREALNSGRRVATNIDVFLHELMPKWNKSTLTRLPDHPSSDDLIAIGRGSNSKDEDTFGILVLDESGTFLNARQWQKSDRTDFNHISRMARKLGWKLILISQHKDLLDKQIRQATLETFIECKRLDRMLVPFFGFIAGIFGFKLSMPKWHLSIARYGSEQHAPVAGRSFYRATNLYNAYDTNQIYQSATESDKTDTGTVASMYPLYFGSAPGLHSVLSSWHVKGRYLTFWQMYKNVIWIGIFTGCVLGYFARMGYVDYVYPTYLKPVDVVAEVTSQVGKPEIHGYMLTSNSVVVDATIDKKRSFVESFDFRFKNSDVCYKLGGAWYGLGC